MKLFETSSITFRDKYVDVREWVTQIMTEGLDKCFLQKRIVDWDKFYDYCMEYFMLPISTMEACIPLAKERSLYNEMR